MNNSFIFGKDPTENIVNITLKDDHVNIYTEELDGTVKLERLPYSPWVLSHKAVNPRSELLVGNQYYKYMTTTSCEKFNKLKETYEHNCWLTRSIEECFMLCEGSTYYKNMKVEDVSVLSFDIETSGLVLKDDSTVFIISNTFRFKDDTFKRLFSLDEYPDQKSMIEDWCKWVRKVNPSIMCGHNILSFDLPYMQHCNREELSLGRDRSPMVIADKTSKFRKDGSQAYDFHNIQITGREIVDTFFLSMKYDIAREFPSYGLKPIVKHLNLEKEGRTFIDATKIPTYYKERGEMWDKAKMYAEEDSDDSLKLFDLMIPASFYLAQSLAMTLQQIINTATGSQVNNFLVRSYIQDGHSIPKADKINEYLTGGISFGIPGLYKNMVKVDLKSAYPSQILRFKIYDKEKDPKGYFYDMVKYFTYERFDLKDKFKETKNQYYHDREQTAKVFVNSAYGALSTNYLNFNSPALASKITYETREVINLALKWASGKDKDFWIEEFKEKTGA